MKIIQLNAWKFRFLEEMLEFLKKEKPDIINLQEVSSGKFNNHKLDIQEPFEFLKKELKMDGVFAPFTGLKSEDGSFSESGNGFLTNLEILDFGIIFEKTLPPYTIYSDQDDLIQTTLKNDKSKYYNVFKEPKNLIWCLLKKDGKYFRNLTTHFTASYGCTETLQTLNQTESVLNYLKYTKNLPTIFSGDLNIHPKSASVEMLSQNLKMLNSGEQNTLNPLVHPIFKNSQSKGLKVDYIFQNGFEVVDYKVPDITVSDHLPLIAELEMLS
jgi:endonuclease/exonuclease/phosphatase family metal-dependent hydrolase